MPKPLTSKIKAGFEKSLDYALPVFSKINGKTGKKVRSFSLKRERSQLEENIAGQLVSLGRVLYEKLSDDKKRMIAKQLDVEIPISQIAKNVTLLSKLDCRINQDLDDINIYPDENKSKNIIIKKPH